MLLHLASVLLVERPIIALVVAIGKELAARTLAEVAIDKELAARRRRLANRVFAGVTAGALKLECAASSRIL